MRLRPFQPGFITVAFGLLYLMLLGVTCLIPYLVLAGFHGLMPLQNFFQHFFERVFPFLTVRPEDYDKANIALRRGLFVGMGFVVGFIADAVVQIAKLVIRKLNGNET